MRTLERLLDHTPTLSGQHDSGGAEQTCLRLGPDTNTRTRVLAKPNKALFAKVGGVGSPMPMAIGRADGAGRLPRFASARVATKAAALSPEVTTSRLKATSWVGSASGLAARDASVTQART